MSAIDIEPPSWPFLLYPIVSKIPLRISTAFLSNAFSLELITYIPLQTAFFRLVYNVLNARNLRLKYLHRFFLLNSSKILINFMMNLRIYIQILLFSSPPFKETSIFSRLKTVRLLNYPQIVCFKSSPLSTGLAL